MKPIAKVLVANRGEIAVRIIRACHEMGIRSAAVYSDADRDALHVRFAHEAYPLGAPEPAASYLNIDRIVEIARDCGTQAIHPGYGFLAENARFARACRDADLIFIGPPPEALEAVGDKVRARETMIAAGVPVIPGTPPLSDDPSSVAARAAEIGYPVLIKAAAGGGGKGMRVARNERELPALLAQARGEARSAFGDPTLFLEKLIVRPRHIEVQVLADAHGTCLALGERECSIQRRHQKLIEESPSPAVDAQTRASLQELALRAVRAVGYVNAGTVEFLRDADGRFYFIEVNARLQVEHPVTEMVTGIDLVRSMIEIAGGGTVPARQEDIELRGHAVECRIVAEDPARNFLPSPGTIRGLRTPSGPGIRYDDGTYAGWTVPVHYDPMIAKLVAWGRSRSESISRMARALDELRIDGLTTSIPLHRKVMASEAFQRGELHTGFLEQHPELLVPAADPWLDDIAVVAAAIAHFRRMEARSAAGGTNDTPGRSAWRRGGRAGWGG